MCRSARWRRLDGDMEFLALIIWLLLAAGGGLTACLLYIVLDAPLWAGGARVGLSLLGILGAGLAAWGPTHALRTVWGIALLGALIAAGVVALRHQTLREVRDVEVAGADGQVAARVTGSPVGKAGV